MLLANHLGRQDTAGGLQRINGGIDTQRSDTTVQNGGSIQVGEGGSGGGVGQVVRGDVDSLNGGDGTLLGGGDTLLQVFTLRAPKL